MCWALKHWNRCDTFSPPMKTILAFTLLTLANTLGQDNWPQFRGEHSLGVANNPNLPTSWSTNQNVAWQANVPGMGWSSPIVWGNKIFLTSVVRDGDVEPPKKGLYLGGERPTPSKDTH